MKKIGLEGTESKTGRELLDSVVKNATDNHLPSFACEMQRYGAAEQFNADSLFQDSKMTVRAVPRYFLVGEPRGPSDRVLMKNQSKLVAAIRGAKVARIKDKEAVQRRQAGWKDWAEGVTGNNSRTFALKELPVIKKQFE